MIIPRRLICTTAAVGCAAALWAPIARAHVSFHPNAIPEGSYITTYVRVPNEVDHATISSVRIKLPDGVLSALGDPPPGWKFTARTRRLAKPIKTDDGVVTTEVTEVDYTDGDTPPGQFANLPLTLSMPSSARQGAVVSFPTVQTYSNGQIVRWIDPSADDEHPAPTVDVTAPGSADLDVTGGDAGPPAKLPADLVGSGAAASAGHPVEARTIVKHDTSTLSIVALVVGALGLLVGGGSLAGRRRRA